MEWKRLVQFALQGSSDLEQYAILLIRVSIGLFFAISGANKLFVGGGTKPVYDTLVKAKVPFPHQTAYFVAGVEFVGGSLLTVGFLSSAACVALLVDMTVATLTDALSTMPTKADCANRRHNRNASVRDLWPGMGRREVQRGAIGGEGEAEGRENALRADASRTRRRAAAVSRRHW